MAQPDLPDDADLNWEWGQKTREWWAAWGRDPRTANCTEADWNFLLEAAILHTIVWDDGDYTQLANLRSQELAFMGRLDKYATKQEATPIATPADSAAVAMMDKYRKRRTG
ncbi:hypothetical protein HMPREF1301_00222 [Propionibacterium sp. KPL2005]|nr:hypothetical protein HMPREF1301_00222 [Propionibacterium sp. KPL2005]ERS26736.1 hypothetical protein HMPREF1297_02326 [Propionibacterium sp. KPL2000]